MKNQLIKRCEGKIFPLYTKTFGGKICKNLHSVSPGNISSKKFKMAPLKFSRQKHASKVSCKKNGKSKTPIWSLIQRKQIRFFSFTLC